MTAQIIPFPSRPGDAVRRFARQIEEAALASGPDRDFLDVTTTPGLHEPPTKLRQDICPKCHGEGYRHKVEGGTLYADDCPHCDGRGMV